MHKHRKHPTIIGTVSMVSLDQSTTVAPILLIMMDFSCKVLYVAIALCKIKPRHYVVTLY